MYIVERLCKLIYIYIYIYLLHETSTDMHVLNNIAAGACGFGEYGRTVNDANVAGVSRLYKNGTGCGGCYQVLTQIQTT
jgi:hypothetical protein